MWGWWFIQVDLASLNTRPLPSHHFSYQVDESQTGEPGWLGGELKGKTGWFPANYAEKIPENEVPTQAKPTTTDMTCALAPKLALREAPSQLATASAEPSATPNNWADFSSTYV